jgi:nucleoside-diphosphate-sugar epimerase
LPHGTAEYVLGGYVRGKQAAEEALRRHFPTGGVAIRPSVIYGSRVVSNNLTLPLHFIFQPLESLLSNLPAQRLSQVPVLGAVMTPPVSVQAVARAAVRAATDPSVPAGIIDVWGLQQYK